MVTFMKFAAPEASVLIVDDNEINLEVTAALLEPLKMKVDLAESGKRALILAHQKRYHLIFMDQMMPDLDGVETTKRLRRLPDAYCRTVPVIALTANAFSEVREELQQAGMNDYLAKPVEAKDLYRCVLKWIPRKLIIVSQEQQKPGGSSTSAGRAESKEMTAAKAPERATGSAGAVSAVRTKQAAMADTGTELAEGAAGSGKLQGSSTLPQLPGINPADGIRYTGSEKMWLKLLGDFYKLIDSKAKKLENCVEDGLIRDYTIEVHALKNTARMIGAARLSEHFFQMEKCGKAGEVETIRQETPGLIRELKSYKEILRPFGEKNDRNKREVPVSEWIAQLKVMRDAMERFSLDTVDETMQQLEQYRVPEQCSESMEILRAAVADVKMKDVMDAAERMIAELQP